MLLKITLFLLLIATAAVKHTAQPRSPTLSTDLSQQSSSPKLQQTSSIPRNLAAVSRSNIRLTLDTYLLNSVTTGTTLTVLNFIKNIMSVVQTFIIKRIKVYPYSGNIRAPSTPCVDYTAPSNDQTNGIASSDLHVYVTYITDATKTFTVTGKYCLQIAAPAAADSTLSKGRPIVGRVKFNTAYQLDGVTLTNRLFAEVTSQTLREMIHILGFDSALYPYYLDSTTYNFYTSSTGSAGLDTTIRPSTIMIKTPKVVAWAKDYYGCTTLTGMQLENQGKDGDSGTGWETSTGSHWQRSVIYDELMTRTSLSAQRALSGLTYSLLTDMGWYTVDGTFNDTITYGYKRDCEFLQKVCKSSVNSTYTEFCNPSSSNKVCTPQYLSKGVCQSTPYSDTCGIIVQSLNCVDENAQSDSYKAYGQEVYGVSSFCVSASISTVGIDPTLQSRCYPYTCYDNGTIRFAVGTNYIYCLPGDTDKFLSGYTGKLTCPTFSTFCTNSRKMCPNWCSQNGYCTGGICNCKTGYSGVDCTVTKCASNQFYIESNNTCSTSCPNGFYSNSYSRTCRPCIGCGQCSGEPTICTKCRNGIQFMYNGVCLPACPNGTFYNGTECQDCNTTACKTCSMSINNCTSCNGVLYLSTDTFGTCNAGCSGTYSLKNTVKYQCVRACPDNLIESSGSCISCPAGQYKNVDPLGCVNICPDFYYADTTLQMCSACDITCKTCNGQTKLNCVTCKTDRTEKYWFLNMCVANSSCPMGMYADDSVMKCMKCPDDKNCSTCSNQTGTLLCTQCKYGYYMSTTGSLCTQSCAGNQFAFNGNNSCVNCTSPCYSCTSKSNTSCTGCIANYNLLTNSSGGFCLTSCPTQGYYSDGSWNCLPCYSTCKTCDGGLISNCLSCVSGMYLYDKHCYYACPSGSYKDNSTYTCLNCSSICMFCFGPSTSNCSKCISGYVLDNTSCVTKCSGTLTANQWNVCSWTGRIGFWALGMVMLLALLLH